MLSLSIFVSILGLHNLNFAALRNVGHITLPINASASSVRVHSGDGNLEPIAGHAGIDLSAGAAPTRG